MRDVDFSGNGEDGGDFLETIPEQFIITEQELDPAMYEEFLAVLEADFPAMEYGELLQQGEQLVDKGMSIAQKKLALAQLAQWGTAEAYRLVQAYSARPDPSLEQWSKVALYECRMRLESELLDEPVGLISTGLGGDGERLRYIFVLVFFGEPLVEEQQQEMRQTLDNVCQKYRSLVEEAQFRSSCLYVQVLVPLDVAVGTVIEESVAQLNQRDGRVQKEYMVTNVAEPSEEEIQDFLNGLR